MPLFWLSLAFISGILLSANLTLPIIGWILIIVVSLLLSLPPVYQRWKQTIPLPLADFTQRLKIPSLRIYPLLFLFISLGAIQYQITRPAFNPAFIAYYNDQPAEFILEGVLVDPPDARDTYTNLRLRIELLRGIDDDQLTQVSGLLLARISPGTAFS